MHRNWICRYLVLSLSAWCLVAIASQAMAQTGDLTVTVDDQNNQIASNGSTVCKLYLDNGNYNYTYLNQDKSTNPATWTGLNAHGYYVEAYHNGASPFGGSEFWGAKAEQVNAGQTTSDTLVRTEPHCPVAPEFRLGSSTGNKLDSSSVVQPGQTIWVSVPVTQSTGINQNVEVQLALDRAKDTSYDLNTGLSAAQTCPSGQTTYFTFTVTPTQSGTYYYALQVQTYTSAAVGFAKTDGWNWLPAFMVPVECSAGWVQTMPMLMARSGYAITRLNDGRILVAGGTTTSVEIYNPAAMEWTAAASMGTPRSYPSSVLLADGRVLVSGGMNASNLELPSAEVYDPSADAWFPTGAMPKGKRDHGSILLNDGRVLVCGNATDDTTAELYDPASNSWSLTGFTTGSHDQIFSLTLLPSGRVLAAGGFDGSFGTSRSEEYDPSSGTWINVSWMKSPTERHTATLLRDGKVLVTGGFTGAQNLSACELYDPDTFSWTTTGSLNVARSGQAAVQIGSGEVLVAGGSGDATAEVYSPVSGQWRMAPDQLQVARTDGAMYRNDDGMLVAAGGDTTVSVEEHCDTACIGPQASIAPPTNVALGGTITLHCIYTGTEPVDFQWFEGSSGVSSLPVGDNSPSYTTASLSADASYWVRTSNGCGSADSDAVTVNVCTLSCQYTVPATWPVNTIAAFSATATPSGCTGTPSYDWDFGDGSAHGSGATVLHAYTVAGTYNWSVAASMAGATPCTDSGTITISSGSCTAPSIDTQPASTAIASGGTTTLMVAAGGDPPLHYQWYQGTSGDTGTPVGADAASYTTPALTATASYWAEVSNGCGSVDSDTATVSVPASEPIFFDDFTSYQDVTDLSKIWPGGTEQVWHASKPGRVAFSIGNEEPLGNGDQSLVLTHYRSDGVGDQGKTTLWTPMWFRYGTYVAVVKFDDSQAIALQDTTVQSFYTISAASDPTDFYSELDFEYLPYNTWGGSTDTTLWMTCHRLASGTLRHGQSFQSPSHQLVDSYWYALWMDVTAKGVHFQTYWWDPAALRWWLLAGSDKFEPETPGGTAYTPRCNMNISLENWLNAKSPSSSYDYATNMLTDFVFYERDAHIDFNTVWQKALALKTQHQLDNAGTYPKPAPPTDLAAQALSQNSLQVSWANPGGGTQFLVEFRVDTAGNEGWVEVQPLASGLSTIVAGLKPGLTYDFRARAIDATGNISEYSGEEVPATTPGPLSPSAELSWHAPDPDVSGGPPIGLAVAYSTGSSQTLRAAESVRRVQCHLLAPEAQGVLQGYDVYRATVDEDSAYQKINEELLPTSTFYFFDADPPMGSVFYRVKAVYDQGDSDWSNTASAQVSDACTLICSATVPTTAVGNTPVSFDAAATPTNCQGTPSFLWDFGDGQTSTLQDCTHSYNTSGTYHWTLAANLSGATCGESGDITVNGSCTAPSITGQPQSQTISSGQSASLSVTATGDAPLSYQWYQGTSGSTGSPIAGATSSSYTTPALTATASYWVLVSNGCGNANSVTATITVNTQPLAATAQAQPTSGMAPLNVTFMGSATGGVPPYTFTWNLGDGSTAVTAQDLTHNYFTAGTYGVILMVRDATGTTAQDKHLSIQVKAVTPLSVVASADKTTGTVPLAVTFSATATGGTAPYSYMWSFGDGHTESSETASDTYTQPGSYTSTVTVTDAAGGQATASVTITVSPQPPVITGVQKLTNPLRLKIYGTNFHLACTVKINGAVAMTSWKNGSLLVAKKGKSLKTLLPKGVPVQITIVNTDDGGISAPFNYMR